MQPALKASATNDSNKAFLILSLPVIFSIKLLFLDNFKILKYERIKNAFNLKSTSFIIEVTNDKVKFLVSGYGHGVGMSQYGANGMANNKEITEDGEDFDKFMKALNTITIYLCRKIAGDGEGATKLLECEVSGAKDEKNAKIIAITAARPIT